MTGLARPQGALATQVGGAHYKSMPIQPVEFALVNGLNTSQANIIKYICRHGAKGGAADLKKAIHYCDLWLDIAAQHGLPWPDDAARWLITAGDFVAINRLPSRVAQAVTLVCDGPTPARVKLARAVIVGLLMDCYGEVA